MIWAKSAGRGSGSGVVSVTYDFWAKSVGRGSGFCVVAVTYDFGPKAQVVGRASEWFRSLMILGQIRRPRVRLLSSFCYLSFWAQSAGRGSGFGVVSITYDFGPKA